MLSTYSILSSMDFNESIMIEGLVQNKVEFSNPVLYYLNSYLLNITPEELITEENAIGKSIQPINDRFIYNCILEYYNLKPESKSDFLLVEVFAALHTKEYETKEERANDLERLFHEMKKANIEQESTELLKELSEIHKGKPLDVVYAHLYGKYKKIKEINAEATQLFISLNSGLKSFLNEKENELVVRQMIVTFKKLRALNETFENRNLETITNMSKLILVTVCDQKQLLKNGNQTLNELLKISQLNIEAYPFGVDKFYLQNIYDQIKLYCNANSKNASRQFKSIRKKSKEATNFNFPRKFASVLSYAIESNKQLHQLEKLEKKIKIKKNVKEQISSLTILRDSLLVRSNT